MIDFRNYGIYPDYYGNDNRNMKQVLQWFFYVFIVILGVYILSKCRNKTGGKKKAVKKASSMGWFEDGSHVELRET